MDVTYAEKKKKKKNFSGSYLQGETTLPLEDKDPLSPLLDLLVFSMNSVPSKPDPTLVVIDNFVYNIPTKLESDPSSKNNEWDSFANTSLKAIATKRLQFCLKRKTTAIKPMHTQEFEPRPTNSSISLSTSNVDNDLNLNLNLPIAIRKGTRQCT